MKDFLKTACGAVIVIFLAFYVAPVTLAWGLKAACETFPNFTTDCKK